MRYGVIVAQGAISAMREFAWIFLAGGTGASLRVFLATTIDRRLHESLPYVGTLIINLVGCLAIGLASAVIGPGGMRPVILGGLLGGFTTYSAFGLLTWDLLRNGRYLAFAGQILVHLIGGLLCVWAGLALGRAIAGEPRLP